MSDQECSAITIRDVWAHLHGAQRGWLAVFAGVRARPEGKDLADVRQLFFRYPEDAAAAAAWLDEEAAGGREVYFCAHLLTERRRKKAVAAPIHALWADSDAGVIPESCPPTLVIESSPGHHHAFWRLSRPLEPLVAEQLNARLAILCRADPSGADLTQLLRPPGYLNHKYAETPRTRILSIHDTAYDPDELDRLLPPLLGQRSAVVRDGAVNDPDPPPVRLYGEALARWRGERIESTESGECDRSASLFQLARVLYDGGASAETTIAALRERDATFGWNKFTGRDNTEYARIVTKFDSAPALTWTWGVSSVSSDSSQPPTCATPFPVEVLPSETRSLVEEAAASLGCAPDLIAVPLIPMAAGVIGKTIQLVVKSGWQERAILWIGVVAEPGTAKSPAQRIAQAPLDLLQREAAQIRRDARIEYLLELDAWSDEPKKDRGPKPEEPLEQDHYYTTDATTEGIVKMLGSERSITPGFVAVYDELSRWVASFNAYRSGGDRKTWLSMWAGAAVKSDRAGRESLYIPEPTVSVVGGIQPDLLPTLVESAGKRDGFVERLLFSVPITAPLEWSDNAVSPATTLALVEVFRALRAAPAGVVHVAPEALLLFKQWHTQNVLLQREVVGLIRGYYAKLPFQAARIALVLRCLSHPTNPARQLLSPQTLIGALAITEYFRGHALAAFSVFGATAQLSHPLAVRLLRALEDRAWTTTDVLYERLGGHIRASALHAALTELVQASVVEQRAVASGEKGGRPRAEWRLTDDPNSTRRLSEETEETEETRSHDDAPVDFDDPALVSSVSSRGATSTGDTSSVEVSLNRATAAVSDRLSEKPGAGAVH